MNELEKALNTAPDYSGLPLGNVDNPVPLTREEKEAILFAYDMGLDAMPMDSRSLIDSVISKLKDQIWA